MKSEEIIKIIDSLNSDLYKNDETEKFCENYGLSFGYTTDGNINIITIMDFMLWNDDNDERDYIDEEDDWEPLEPYIRRTFSELIKNISHMKL